MQILLIRFSSMGDILLTTPIVADLKQQFPDAQIDYVTKTQFGDCVQGNPHLRKVFQLGKQSLGDLAKEIKAQGNYDRILDLHNKLRSRLLILMLKKSQVFRFKKPYLKRFFLIHFKKNWFRSTESIVWQVRKQLKSKLGWDFLASQNRIEIKSNGEGHPLIQLAKKQYLSHPSGQWNIALAPGATWATKQWPVEYFSALVTRLLKQFPRLNLFFCGGAAELALAEKIIADQESQLQSQLHIACGNLSIQQSAALLTNCHILVTNDSGLMHLGSSAEHLRIIALFTATVPEFGFAPFHPLAKILSLDLPCKPCDHKGLSKCPKGHFNCARLLTPEMVYLSLEKTLLSLTRLK